MPISIKLLAIEDKAAPQVKIKNPMVL